MTKIPEPPILTLDPNDENIILKMPDDDHADDSDSKHPTSSAPKEKMKVNNQP